MNITELSIKELNALNKDTLMEHLNIEYIEVKDGYVKAKMPVDGTTRQPDGILHGGANLALAETVAGLGSAAMVDFNKIAVRGAQISGNHVSSASKGFVFAIGEIIHKGRYTHVWNVNIRDCNDKLVSTCRITNILVNR